MNCPVPHYIVIKGTYGSGKSTLAKRLSKLLELPIGDLDVLFHGPNGSLPPVDAFRATVV